ncbi:unnamed protein product [Nesidiocoris tenuis]|uniref:Uncharacterized protein n=1 Tax=Nesidiocoris tenuis TaxID=355587 RepID=A0A6H5HAB2_9HEMI|nr:unnamed protein product [Nesidiocoris tenuis]
MSRNLLLLARQFLLLNVHNAQKFWLKDQCKSARISEGCAKDQNPQDKDEGLRIRGGVRIRKAPTRFRSRDRAYSYTEIQRYDGWFNNLAHPHWGSVADISSQVFLEREVEFFYFLLILNVRGKNESQMTRRAPAAYKDGVYMMSGDDRPSARRISQLFMKGNDGLPSRKNRTALLAFFGQVVSSEVVMASESGCPIEVHQIPIDKCDEMYDPECTGGKSIPFHRAKYDATTGQSPNSPREQINHVTSWIDGSFVYSTSEAWLSTMRSYENGTLLTDASGNWPVKNTMRAPLFNQPVPHALRTLSPERLFLLGDPRSNQNPALLAFSILWFRWHNKLAERIQNENPDWPDEEIFHRARRLLVAQLQVPKVMKLVKLRHNTLFRCEGSTLWAKRVLQKRFGRFEHHERKGQRPPRLQHCKLHRHCSKGLSIWRPWISIGSLLFVQVRAFFRLPKHKKWSDINPELFSADPTLEKKLMETYGGMDNIDTYIGGMLESKDGPGELFTSIIMEQFTRLRDSDRFWFENAENGYVEYAGRIKLYKLPIGCNSLISLFQDIHGRRNRRDPESNDVGRHRQRYRRRPVNDSEGCIFLVRGRSLPSTCHAERIRPRALFLFERIRLFRGKRTGLRVRLRVPGYRPIGDCRRWLRRRETAEPQKTSTQDATRGAEDGQQIDGRNSRQDGCELFTEIVFFRMTSFHIDPIIDDDKHWITETYDAAVTYLEENRQNIVYLFIFYVLTIALFIERFIHYSFLAEHTDLRHIMGVGIAITRGSAASLSFCYSLLLLTMSRNLLTKLKEFPIQQYIPLDAHIVFHKIVACTALFFSLLHTVGHIVNFYHVSTQPLEHIHCLTSEVHFPSDYKPGITFWLFQTITGELSRASGTNSQKSSSPISG